MPPAIGDIIRIVCKMSNAGNDVINTYHAELQGGPPPATDFEMGTAIASMLDGAYTEIVPRIPDQVTFDSIEMYNITQDYLVGEFPWPTLTTGTSVNTSLPDQTAPLALFNTDTLRSQGRKFLPVFNSGAVDDDGSPSAGALAEIAAYAADIVIGVISGTWDAKFGNWNPTLLRFAQYLTSFIPDFYATQRRRYAGKGT